MEAQAWLKGNKGKGGKPKGKLFGKPAVNAYSTGMFFGGLEMMDVKELQTATTSSLSTSQGLIDCGATASAGPLVAVESLIGSILAKDSRASIDVRQAARPYFRFGNGQWGRALFKFV
jgi:hypothetical protein